MRPTSNEKPGGGPRMLSSSPPCELASGPGRAALYRAAHEFYQEPAGGDREKRPLGQPGSPRASALVPLSSTAGGITSEGHHSYSPAGAGFSARAFHAYPTMIEGLDHSKARRVDLLLPRP